MQERIKDSVIVTYKLQSESFDSTLNQSYKVNQELSNHIVEVNKKVVKLRWNVPKAGVIGVVVGILIGLFAI